MASDLECLIEVRRLRQSIAELSACCGVLEGEFGELFRSFLENLGELFRWRAAGREALRPKRKAEQLLRRLRQWGATEEFSSSAALEEPVVTRFIRRIIEDDHPFLKAAELKPIAQIHPSLTAVMAADLRVLEGLAATDYGHWLGMEEAEVNGAGSEPSSAPWDYRPRFDSLSSEFLNAADWSSMVRSLANHLLEYGRGNFRGAPAFALRERGGRAVLEPVADFAEFPMDWLEGNRSRIELIDRNTKNLVEGHRAGNALIWGPRGCGKSSLIRALIGKYYPAGLRGIEVSPDNYSALPELLSLVRGRTEKFLGVLDNISLAKGDASIRHLSSVLEGSLEQVPDNLVFYATSNFKNLVDREGEHMEGVGPMQMDRSATDDAARETGMRPPPFDAQQGERYDELRALDDRFALKVFIDFPSKAEYEHLVLSYARRAGIDTDPEQLLMEFNVWRMRHGHDLVGGRTARDFVVARLPELERFRCLSEMEPW